MARKYVTLISILLLFINFWLLPFGDGIILVNAAISQNDISDSEYNPLLSSKDLGITYATNGAHPNLSSGYSAGETEQAQTCTPDVSGMLSYWPLDDGESATLFVDVIGDNDGACAGINCPTNTTGVINTAFDFNSMDPDKLDAPADTPSLNWKSTDSFSFELWANATELCVERKVFIAKYRNQNDDGENWASWWVGCGDGNQFLFGLRDSYENTLEIASAGKINIGKWHHIVAERDGSSNQNLLYVDGVLETSQVYTYTGDFISDRDVNFGYYNVDPYYHFDGKIDEVAIYNRVLTLEEIQAHYNGGAGQSYCVGPPLAQDDSYTVEEDSGETIFDVLSNDSLALDSDGTLEIINVGTGSGDGDITTDGGLVFYAPAQDFFGTKTFTYTISDGNVGNNDSATVTVTVTPVEDQPNLINPGDQTSNVGDSVSLQIVANDPDNDHLTFGALGLPPGLSIDPETGVISGGLSDDLVGHWRVQVSVSDGNHEESPSVNFNWNVSCLIFLPMVHRTG
ncbi:MAG: Ig-like domain-containing protein [Anaerolineales bacterium]|jgi:hypothetical protein